MTRAHTTSAPSFPETMAHFPMLEVTAPNHGRDKVAEQNHRQPLDDLYAAHPQYVEWLLAQAWFSSHFYPVAQSLRAVVDAARKLTEEDDEVSLRRDELAWLIAHVDRDADHEIFEQVVRKIGMARVRARADAHGGQPTP